MLANPCVVFIRPVFTLLLVCGITLSSFSQDKNKKMFLDKFNTRTAEQKISMFDTLPDNTKLEYYPYVKEAFSVLIKTGSAEQKNKTRLLLDKLEGIRSFHINDFSSSISIFTRILSKPEVLNAHDSIQCLYYLKNCYIKLNSMSKALDIHKTMVAIKSRSGINDPWVLHPLLSTMYYEMGLHREALNEQKHEYENMPKNKGTLTNFYNNRGIFWSKSGNQDSAIACYNLAKQYELSGIPANRLTDVNFFVIGLIDGNIGQALKIKGEYETAIPLLQKDIYYSKQSNEFINAAISHNELADCYLKLEEYKLCEQHLDSARNILTPGQNMKPILSNYTLYAELFGKTGRYREADSVYRRYVHLRDSVELSDNKKQSINQQVALQLEERENVIRDNREKIIEEHEIIEQQKLQRNGLLAGAILLSVVLLIILVQLRRMSRQKKQLTLVNQEIQEKKDVIEKALHEKEVLVKEVHHRVKNNLQLVSSLLNLQAGKTGHTEAKQALLEAFERVSSMALIHQLLYTNNNMALIPIHTYLKNLFDNLSHSNTVPGRTIIRDFNADPLVLDLDTGIPLGIIANELISNSYKHAFKNRTNGTIHVHLKKLPGTTYALTVSDDGIGIPADFEKNIGDSLGLEIVQLLCEQINGKFSFLNNQGACFNIEFGIKQVLQQ